MTTIIILSKVGFYYDKNKERGNFMKKSNFFVLLAAASLILGACNQNKPASESSKPVDESSEPEQSGYVDPEVELDDIATANTEIDFNEIEDTCMINPKAKTYIDAMEEQEKTLEKPYHFSSLYGPDDYAALAAASNSNNGASIPAANKGGVDVCEILDRNDYGNDCKNYPIKLTWEDDGSFDENTVVKFWSTEDAEDVREVGVSVKDGVVTAELANLFRARKYRLQVINGNEVSQGYEFTTGDYPRTITMGGVHNVRDLGGYVTSYGVRTNQGLIYRGYYIDDKNGGHGINYSAEVQKVQEEVMQIGYEIDLQKSSETNGRTASALNSEATPCDYKCLTLVSYASFLAQDSYKNLPEVMHIIANSDEKHSYFHCWGGADRTGMLAFFINAICGVSYTDLVEDFELTTQTNNKRCHMHNDSNAYFPKFLNEFMNNWKDFDPEATVNENCEKWMIDVAGVDPDDIERIREIMLPGYEDGELEADKLIPEYTPASEWLGDDVAGWQVAEEDANVKCNWHRHKGEPCVVCGHGGSEPQPIDPQPDDDDFTQVISHVWTVSKKENNSDGKEYEQLNDANKNKVGVRIAINNYSSSSTGVYDSDGKLPSDENKAVTYKIKAPKAGTYQMIMNGRVSDTAYKLGERGITVTVNGTAVNIEGDDRDGGLSGQGDNDFVIAPSVTLTGNEDTITVACRYYRIKFNLSSYVTFAEH